VKHKNIHHWWRKKYPQDLSSFISFFGHRSNRQIGLTFFTNQQNNLLSSSTMSSDIIDSFTNIFSAVHKADPDAFLFSHPAFIYAVEKKNAEPMNKIVSLWVQERYTNIWHLFHTKPVMKLIKILGIKRISFTNITKDFFSRLCPDDILHCNLTTCKIPPETKLQTLAQILVWSFVSIDAMKQVLGMLQKGFQQRSHEEWICRQNEGEHSLDLIWSWLLSFTKCVSSSVITTCKKLLSKNLDAFHCFFLQDSLEADMSVFFWLGVSPEGTVDKLVLLEQIVPDTPEGNHLKRNKVLLFTACYVSISLRFSIANNKDNHQQMKSDIIDEISIWLSLPKTERRILFVSTVIFLNSIHKLKLCLHESIQKELNPKRGEELTDPFQIETDEPPSPPPVSTVSNVQKIQFHPQKSNKTMINYFETSWNSHSGKSLVKNLFNEMSFLQKKGVSVGTVSQFLNQLKYPPDGHKCTSTIAFLYYLTEHLSLRASTGEEEIQTPLLPAYAALLFSLDFIFKSRNPIVRKEKWSNLCEVFNPEEESNNHLLHIYLAKCLNGRIPDISHPGLFGFLTKFFTTDPSNSNPEGLSNQIKHSNTASASAAGGQLTRVPIKGAKADAKAGAKVGAKADAKAGAKAGSKVGAKAGAKAGVKADAKADAKAGAKAKAGGHKTTHATARGYLEKMTTEQHKAGGKNIEQQAASPVKKTRSRNNPGNFTLRSSPRKRKLPQNEKDDKKYV
jgi:hypothetical protein